MAYFAGRLQEINGEQEYHYDHIIKADSLEDAVKLYEEYAKNFYSDDDVEKTELGFEFFGGTIIVSVGSVWPTTKQQWLKDQFIMNLISARAGNK